MVLDKTDIGPDADKSEWQVAESQSERIAKLLGRRTIVPQVLSLGHHTTR